MSAGVLMVRSPTLAQRASMLAAIGMLSTTAACQAATPMRWGTHYAYSYKGGANAAGTGVVVDYDLSLGPQRCVFTAEGYQTDETILCVAHPSADKMRITFKSYGDGKVVDARGNSVYSAGDTLFDLERRGGRLVTRWEGYPLPDDRPHAPAVNFVEVRR